MKLIIRLLLPLLFLASQVMADTTLPSGNRNRVRIPVPGLPVTVNMLLDPQGNLLNASVPFDFSGMYFAFMGFTSNGWWVADNPRYYTAGSQYQGYFICQSAKGTSPTSTTGAISSATGVITITGEQNVYIGVATFTWQSSSNGIYTGPVSYIQIYSADSGTLTDLGLNGGKPSLTGGLPTSAPPANNPTASDATSTTTTTRTDASGNVTGTNTTTGTTNIDFSPLTSRLDKIATNTGVSAAAATGSGTGGTGSGGSGGTGTDMTATNAKLDMANGHLDDIQKTIGASRESPGDRAAHDAGWANNQAASAAVPAHTGFDNNGNSSSISGYNFGGGSSGAAEVTGITISQIPGHTIFIPTDPVVVSQRNGFTNMFAVGRALISVGLLVLFYKYIVLILSPLVASMFNSEAASTSLVETGQAGVNLLVTGIGGFQVSATRPLISAARLALMLAFPLAVMVLVDLYAGINPNSGGSFFTTSATIGGMLVNMRSVLGRSYDFLNLLLPIDFMLMEGVYSTLCSFFIFSGYATMKAKSAALQSI